VVVFCITLAIEQINYMNMKNTQSNKLAKVLEIGSISCKSLADAYATDANYLTADEFGDFNKRGCKYWIFTPYDTDGEYERIAQFSTNPFTLIDIIFYSEFEAIQK
jgi:hypothetical protein